ncbi:MAG: aspartate--tRNA ligase, partial [Armatimonadetes bacterium]|nr:aspartate--tRNA ligase [Armatimonadota bacterium]
ILGPGTGIYSRKQIDDITELAKSFGAKGLVTIQVTEDGIKSPSSKFLTEAEMSGIVERCGAKVGDMMMIVADDEKTVANALSRLRIEIGSRLNLCDPNMLYFCWIVDFPLLKWDDEAKRWDSEHHQFTSPFDEDIPLLDTEPGKVRSNAYDLACNGNECASGSIRIHQREVQSRIFDLLGYAATAVDPMTEAPSPVTEDQLKELHIRLREGAVSDVRMV